MSLNHATAPSTSSTTLLTELFDKSPNGIIAYQTVRDANGSVIDYRTLYVNNPLISITGYSAEELTGQLLFERAPYTRAQAEAFQLLVDTGQSFDFKYFNERSGRWLTVQNRPLSDGFFATFQDVTELEEVQQQLEAQARQLRQQTEQALQQQALLNSVLEASPTSITVERAVRDETGRVVDFQAILINTAALQLGGHTEEQALTQRISALNPLFESSGLLAAYRDVIETGHPLHLDVFYPPRNKHLELLVTRMDSEHIIVLFTDITQAKHYADELRRKNSLLDGILRTSDNAILVYDAVLDAHNNVADFRVVLANKTAEQVFGNGENSLMGVLLTERHPNTKSAGLWQRYVTVYESGITSRDTYHDRDARKWFDVSINKLGDGLVATFSDITLAESAAQQIKEQSQLFDSVLENMTNGLLVLEAIRNPTGDLIDLRYVRVSRSVLRDMGRQADDVIGNTILTLHPATKDTIYWATYKEVLQTGEPRRFETHYTGEGLDNYLDNWITRLDENRIISVYSIINEQKQAEQRTAQLVQELKRSNTNLEQFAYVASHDLQEPLRKIQQFGVLLESLYADALPDDGRDMLRRMQSAATRMNVLIRDLLTFSRLSTQQEPFQPVNLSKLIDGITTDLELSIQEKHAQVNLQTPGVMLNGSPLQLQQLFQNLISNALKFGRPGIAPQVTIAARSVSPGNVPSDVRNRQQQAWVMVDVADNGIGFNEEYRERIFQLFERLHGRSEYSGTGIGLAICRRVAENHGGTITAHSQPGQGATFRVYLPMK